VGYRDLRDFLVALEERGRLRRVTRPVDRSWELACIARWLYQAVPERERFGLLFENAGAMPIGTAAIGASRETYAIALGTTPDGINPAWVQALAHPIAPVLVTQAPCQEVVLTGESASLAELPIPVWTPGRDAAPYLTTLTLTKDAESGFQNCAVYRTMVLDERRVAVNLNPGRHGTLCVESYHRRGRPAPIAWVIATEPVVHCAAVVNVPYGVDEVSIAGGLKGAPVETVKARTVDLAIPAHAEIVVEGEIRPGDRAREGPFGEFAGYMSAAVERPVATITAITHRRDPLYYGYVSQFPPSESTTIQSLGNCGLVLKRLRDLGHAGVRDVHIDLTYGGMLAHGVVAMRPQYRGHALQVGRIVADTTLLKRVTVVDDDIDIRDSQHLDWALNARYDPARDTVLVPGTFSPAEMDPAVRTEGREAAGSKIVIDATEKWGAQPFSLPPRHLMEQALESWHAAGLPPIEVPRRVDLALARE
jgi:UbiD family decarboxylase